MARGPYSVVQKSRVPPSGDKHDYLSQAPYWWPDPAKPDGLPYIR
ncbi:MAG: alginate lyase family protein [Ignavibacteriota bacterium]